MSGLGDKIKGKAQEATGAVKEGLGKATDNPDMQGEGMADKAKGQGNQAKGNVKEAADKVGDAVGDAADAVRRKTD
jgi:uncharacterized protein YjbJ (UPF0337 family)